MRRLLLWPVLGLVIVGVATLALAAAGRLGGPRPTLRTPQSGAGEGPPAQPAVAVQAAPVQRRTIVQEALYYGVLEPRLTVRLAPRMAGRVAAVRAQVGQRVKAGDELVRLETAELEVQVEQARATLAQAEARYQRLKAGPTPEELEQARAAVAQAVALRDQARRELERTEALRRSGAATEQAYEAALSRFRQAEAQWQSAQAALESLEAGANAYDLAAAEAEVRRARAALEMARLQLSYASLRSPVDGIVTEVALEVGESASPAAPALTLADIDELRVVVRVPAEDALRLAAGATATVEPRAMPGRQFAGRVHRIDPVADPQSHLFGVEVRVPNRQAGLRAGLDVTVRIPLQRAEGVLAVPIAAVTRWDDREGVFVVREGQAAFQPVELGISDGQWRQVLSGLEEGQLVVTTGKEFLQPGSPVRVAPQG